jgi:hypothetical protein
MYEALLYLNAAVFAGVAAWYARRDYASIFHPASFYLAFHGLIFVFRPFLAYYGEYEAIYRVFRFRPTEEDMIVVLVGAMLGFLAFMLAVTRIGGVTVRIDRDQADAAERRHLMKPFLITLLLCGPIALYSLLYAWEGRAIGNLGVVMDGATGLTVNSESHGYFKDSQVMLTPLVALVVWFGRFRLWTILPVAAFVVLRVGTGGRWPLVACFVLIGLLYLSEKGRRWPPAWTVLALMLLTIPFTAISQDRGRSVRELFVEDRVAAYDGGGARDRFMEGMDFANLEYYQYLVYAIPKRTGTYGYFVHNLQILTEPIPRVLWPDKPVGAPIKLYSLLEYGRPIGMTNSLPGEGWAQLGFAGVVLWCGLAGALLGWVYRRFASRRPSNLTLIAYATLLSLSITFFRDGLLITLLRTGLFCFLPLAIMALAARFLAQPTAAELRAAPLARRRTRAEPAEPAAVTPRSRRQAAFVPRAHRPREAAAPAE